MMTLIETLPPLGPICFSFHSKKHKTHLAGHVGYRVVVNALEEDIGNEVVLSVPCPSFVDEYLYLYKSQKNAIQQERTRRQNSIWQNKIIATRKRNFKCDIRKTKYACSHVPGSHVIGRSYGAINVRHIDIELTRRVCGQVATPAWKLRFED